MFTSQIMPQRYNFFCIRGSGNAFFFNKSNFPTQKNILLRFFDTSILYEYNSLYTGIFSSRTSPNEVIYLTYKKEVKLSVDSDKLDI